MQIGNPLATGNVWTVLTQLALRFRTRFEYGDALMTIYFLVVVRQWFNILPNNLAWGITFVLALVFWLLYVLTKDLSANRSSFWFWLIVGLPLLFAYSLRFPFPDSSFDVWSLRLFHGERALKGFLYWPGEFFPTAAPFNPTPDMITGIFRHALGYRLGTIVNLLVLLWVGTVVDKLLRPYFRSEKLRAVFVLIVLCAEQLLFEINNYMPDLLALPLLLEATRLTLDSTRKEFDHQAQVLRVALLLGLAVGLKLSNGAVAMPLVIIWVWRIFTTRPLRVKSVVKIGLASSALFFAPFFSFALWVYRMTGNPIFPLYNKLFQSPLYPPFNGWDNRWGGYGVWEIMAWPVLMFFEPVRTSELPVYTGRLTVAFIVSLLCLVVINRLERRVRTMVFVLLLGSWLWSLTMGYIRYGLYLEVMSGILLVALVANLWTKAERSWRTVATVGLVLVLVAQAAMAWVYLSRTEWSIRPTAFDEFKSFKRETKYLFTDRSIRTLLEPEDRNVLDDVDVWIVSGVKTSGLLPFLNNRAPCISVRFAGLLLTQSNRDALSRSLENARGKQMWSLAINSDYKDSLFALRGAGLKVSKIREFNLPFFSPDDIVPTYLFQVVEEHSKRPAPERTVLDKPLVEEGYRATLEALNAPQTFKHDRTLTLFVRITNASDVVWPSVGSSEGRDQIAISARWLQNNKPNGTNGEVTLPYDLSPGEATILPISLNAPTAAGKYTLQVDLVQRDVKSFGEKGSKPLELEIEVEP